MDLDEMKAMWQQHDKILQQNKMLNEKLVHHLLQNKSKTAVAKMINFETFGVAFCAILSLAFLLRVQIITVDPLLAISYCFMTLAVLASTGLSWYKISLLRKIDLANGTVTDIAQRIEYFKLVMTRERMWGIVGLPLLIIAGIGTVTYWVTGVNVYEDFMMLVPQIIIASAVGLVVMIVGYKFLYFNNIKEIRANLEEIKQFMD